MERHSTVDGSIRHIRRWIDVMNTQKALTRFALILSLIASSATAQEIFSVPNSTSSPYPAPAYATPDASLQVNPLRSGTQLIPPSTGTARVANKVSVPTVDRSHDGATYVALASGLEAVFNGREPTSLRELKALELQQSRVASAIENVTVNVQQGSAQGSGVIITADGYVLTAAHVAGNKNREARVILNDGTQLKARTLGMNRDKDAGLLKIEDDRWKTPLPYATIGRSSELHEGQWCIASGHPGGWKPERGAAIRVGRILKISKNRNEKDAHTLFTDCALIGGDSGGPLFTLEGKLIGIHSRIGTDVIDNMHVPIDVFATSWDRMKRGEVWGMLPGYQPVIGVSGTKDDDRPLIASILPGGPADKAGLQAGDLILTFDGMRLSTFSDLRENVENSMPGDVVTLTIRRADQTLRLPIRVGVAD